MGISNVISLLQLGVAYVVIAPRPGLGGPVITGYYRSR
jgi:hypothetical protein